MISNLLRNSPLRPLLGRIKGIGRKKHALQRHRDAPGQKLRRLGSAYGGWTFVEDKELHGSTIISAGLGEDGSFDVEFARKYSARVVIVDPTPRAVEHFNAVCERIGRPRRRSYVNGGGQPADAYPLDGLKDDQLRLIQNALWNEKRTLKFFAPKNPAHVSHSIINYQNNYSDTSDHIEVQAITFQDLLEDLSLSADDIPLVKLDIEGAEIEVIGDLLDSGLRPGQICVEYDEFNFPSARGIERIERCHQKLLDSNYLFVHTDGKANFLYKHL